MIPKRRLSGREAHFSFSIIDASAVEHEHLSGSCQAAKFCFDAFSCFDSNQVAFTISFANWNIKQLSGGYLGREGLFSFSTLDASVKHT